MIATKCAPPNPPSSQVRLFFALLPDPQVRAALAALAAAVAGSTGGRVPRVENIHLTLAFLGTVPRERLPDLGAIGQRAAAIHAPFAFRLDRLGLFRNAGVAWAAPRAACEPLDALHETLRDALEQAGMPLEHREFRAHVTLARRATRAPEGVAEPAVSWDVDAIALMSSEPGPHGVRYRELGRWPLAATTAP